MTTLARATAMVPGASTLQMPDEQLIDARSVARPRAGADGHAVVIGHGGVSMLGWRPTNIPVLSILLQAGKEWRIEQLARRYRHRTRRSGAPHQDDRRSACALPTALLQRARVRLRALRSRAQHRSAGLGELRSRWRRPPVRALLPAYARDVGRERREVHVGRMRGRRAGRRVAGRHQPRRLQSGRAGGVEFCLGVGEKQHFRGMEARVGRDLRIRCRFALRTGRRVEVVGEQRGEIARERVPRRALSARRPSPTNTRRARCPARSMRATPRHVGVQVAEQCPCRSLRPNQALQRLQRRRLAVFGDPARAGVRGSAASSRRLAGLDRRFAHRVATIGSLRCAAT